MFGKCLRNLSLAATLIALACSALHASPSGSRNANAPVVVANDGPTGGDPDPTGPDSVQIMLILLQLGVEYA